MSNWNSKNVARTEKALQVLKQYIHTNGLRQSPPTLSNQLIVEIESALSKSLNRFLKFSKGEINFRSLSRGVKSEICLHCKLSFAEGNSKSLCNKCKQDLPKEEKVKYRVQHYEQTCMKRMGRKNIFAGKAGNKVARFGMKNQHGVDNPNKIPEVRARATLSLQKSGKRRAAKGRATMQRREGVNHWTQIPSKIQEMADRLEAQYGEGIRNVMDIPEVRAVWEESMNSVDWNEVYEKVCDATESRFGVRNVFELTDWIAQKRFEKTGCYGPWSKTAQEKYKNKTGHLHPLQNPEIFERMVSSSFTRKSSDTDFKIVGRSDIFQGDEVPVVHHLQKCQKVKRIFTGKEVPSFYYTSRNTYQPDLGVHIKGMSKTIIEVKSHWHLAGKEEWLKTNYKKFKTAYSRYGDSFYLCLSHRGQYFMITNPAKLLREAVDNQEGINSKEWAEFMIKRSGRVLLEDVFKL